MTRFFLSDIHLRHKLVSGLRGHWTLDQDGVKFPDLDAHSQAIAYAWDSVVRPEDEVFLLGDLSINSGQHVLDWIDERPGRVHLFSGNHDSTHPMHRESRKTLKLWWPHFESIQSEGTIQLAGQKVHLSHFPYWSWGDGDNRESSPRYPEWRVPEVPGRLLIHGHTHGKEQAHGNQFHVGWDAWGRLVTEHEISAWVEERVASGDAWKVGIRK